MIIHSFIHLACFPIANRKPVARKLQIKYFQCFVSVYSEQWKYEVRFVHFYSFGSFNQEGKFCTCLLFFQYIHKCSLQFRNSFNNYLTEVQNLNLDYLIQESLAYSTRFVVRSRNIEKD